MAIGNVNTNVNVNQHHCYCARIGMSDVGSRYAVGVRREAMAPLCITLLLCTALHLPT